MSGLVTPSLVAVAQSAPRYLNTGYKSAGWRQEGQLAAKTNRIGGRIIMLSKEGYNKLKKMMDRLN